MKKSILLFFIFLILISSTNIAKSQNSRVTNAYTEKKQYLLDILKEKNINSFKIDLIIIGLKKERTLQVWAKHKDSLKYKHLIDYEFCSFSGKLGPKRQQGDMQIPEGFYYISYFNQWSSFHLSLKVSYPNASDKILGKKESLGNDIYIHGACCTIGCIPITDDKIKELYVLCLEARKTGYKKIPVYIFPGKLDAYNFIKLKKEYEDEPELISFWEDLKIGYNIFMKTKLKLKYTINKKGKYVF